MKLTRLPQSLTLLCCALLTSALSTASALAETLLVFKNNTALSVRIASDQDLKRRLPEENGFLFESESTKQSYDQITHALSAIISEQDALKAFAFVSAQPQIPFAFTDDGCYARAHEMALLLEMRGILSKKVFVYGELAAKGKYGSAHWKYHVAPLVQVRRANGEVQKMIFDPSLFNTPMPIGSWFTTVGHPQCEDKTDTDFVQTAPIDCIYTVSERFDYLGYDPGYWKIEDIRAARAKLEEGQAELKHRN